MNAITMRATPAEEVGDMQEIKDDNFWFCTISLIYII